MVNTQRNQIGFTKPSGFFCHAEHVESIYELIGRAREFLDQIVDTTNVVTPEVYQKIYTELNGFVQTSQNIIVSMREFYDRAKPQVDQGHMIIGAAWFPNDFSVITFVAGLSLLREHKGFV